MRVNDTIAAYNGMTPVSKFRNSGDTILILSSRGERSSEPRLETRGERRGAERTAGTLGGTDRLALGLGQAAIEEILPV